ncbi:AfsR/SARP family transcriptional regulator [Phytohabitans rumicis]|nr:AfsR/SARP family transcriptional regulator [Phytohabitans rumicis]
MARGSGSGEREREGAATVLFHVLGPLEVHGGDAAACRLGAGKPATLLATLLLQPNAWVAADELTETMWPEHAVPVSVRANLKTYVWQLRRLLPDHDGQPRFERRAGAYRIRVRPGELDAHRFGELTADARRAAAANEPDAAATLLEQALRLWRGRPFAGLDTAAARTVSSRLEQQRDEAREHLAELQVALGRGVDAVATLRAVTAEAPLREGAWVRLVRTLHAAGRRAEAIVAYRQAREVLSTELGVEPGAALTEAYRLVAGGTPSGKVRRELPRDVPLTGRAHELATVMRAATGLMPVVLVDGMAGAGKTAFAVHAAHRLAPAYPDGQFYLDLSGADQQGRPDTAYTLERLLRGIGVPAAAVPSDVDERSALWRSELADRRVLLVLDGVPDGGRLAPLLPAAPACLTLVTTASRGWHLDGAARIALRPLAQVDAAALFRSAAGRRALAEPAAVAAVVRRCGGLPAALRDAAARLQSRPQWTVRRLADELDDDPCRTLTDTVRRSVADVCRRLAGAEQAAWRALGDLPEDFAAAAAAPAMGVTAGAARAAMEALVDRGLLEVVSPERYRSHCLVRHLAKCAAPGTGPSRTHLRDHRRVA